jgi:hypothetical protein
MLRNSLEEEGAGEFEQLARKFNIDLRVVGPEPNGECYHLGVGSHYQIIREHDYYFLALSEGRDDLNQSKIELESIRSGESGLHLLVAPEAVNLSLPSPTKVRPNSRIARLNLGRRATKIVLVETWILCSIEVRDDICRSAAHTDAEAIEQQCEQSSFLVLRRKRGRELRGASGRQDKKT